MERQADELGTRLLASSDYAADGMYHLMKTLQQEKKNQSRPPAWLSTHPEIGERVNNIKTQIVENGYDRYTYEGVSQHKKIKEKVAKLLAKHQLEEEKDNDEEETD
jgi:predicted Zn-dependent protease